MYKLILFVLCTAALVSSQDSDSGSATKQLRQKQQNLASKFAQQIKRPQSEPIVKVTIQVLSELIRSSALGVCPGVLSDERNCNIGGYTGAFCRRRRRSLSSQLEREIVELLLKEEAQQQLDQQQEQQQQQQQQQQQELANQEALELPSKDLAKALVKDLGLTDQTKADDIANRIGKAIGSALSSIKAISNQVCGSKSNDRQ